MHRCGEGSSRWHRWSPQERMSERFMVSQECVSERVVDEVADVSLPRSWKRSLRCHHHLDRSISRNGSLAGSFTCQCADVRRNGRRGPGIPKPLWDNSANDLIGADGRSGRSGASASIRRKVVEVVQVIPQARLWERIDDHVTDV